MIISKYSCILTIRNTKYLFNTFNSALIELDDSSYAKVSNARNLDLEVLFSPGEKAMLISEGILVEETEDYQRELSLKMDYHSSKYKSSSTLKIDIGITDKCNFFCPYCFENGSKNSEKYCKSKYTYAELLSEIRKYIYNRKNHEQTNVEVVWYGGEPSLELDFICFANEKLLSDAVEYGFKYNNVIITNGYCLNTQHIEILKQQNVQYIQITIDGLKESHNRRRNTIPPTDSFETILRNIDLLTSNKIEVVIRINIDSSNKNEIFELLNVLSQRFKNDVIGTLLFVNFGRVFGSRESLSHSEYEAIYHDLYLHASTLGFIEPEFEVPQLGAYCSAESMNDNMVIDFVGNKYKCWNDIFNQSLTTGNIYTNKSEPAKKNEVDTEILYMEKLSLDNVNRGQCLSCEFIKYCGGLCPYNRKLILSGQEENIFDGFICKKIVKNRITTHIEAYLNKIAADCANG